MGQHISHCKTGTEPSIGDFEPHHGESRKRRLPVPKSLQFHNNDDNEVFSRATASTGQSSFNASTSPPSPLGSSSGTVSKKEIVIPDRDTNKLQQPNALRYTNSTRNLQDRTPEASATTATTTTRTMHAIRPHAFQQTHQQARVQQVIHNHHKIGQQGAPPVDKRSNPVKFPRKRFLQHRNDASAHPNGFSHLQETPQDSSYLERMYDSRTWEMYRRITTHRERIEAFNSANASTKDKIEDDRNSTNRTYMSDPVQRVTNSSTMEGGVDYDNFYDPATDDDCDFRGRGFLHEDHSAPPYHHHHGDNGQNHHQVGFGQCHNGECYSEWEHMYGDDVEATEASGKHSTNAHGHETIFLFDF